MLRGWEEIERTRSTDKRLHHCFNALKSSARSFIHTSHVHKGLEETLHCRDNFTLFFCSLTCSFHPLYSVSRWSLESVLWLVQAGLERSLFFFSRSQFTLLSSAYECALGKLQIQTSWADSVLTALSGSVWTLLFVLTMVKCSYLIVGLFFVGLTAIHPKLQSGVKRYHLLDLY